MIKLLKSVFIALALFMSLASTARAVDTLDLTNPGWSDTSNYAHVTEQHSYSGSFNYITYTSCNLLVQFYTANNTLIDAKWYFEVDGTRSVAGATFYGSWIFSCNPSTTSQADRPANTDHIRFKFYFTSLGYRGLPQTKFIEKVVESDWFLIYYL